jgi:hypothetical protein
VTETPGLKVIGPVEEPLYPGGTVKFAVIDKLLRKMPPPAVTVYAFNSPVLGLYKYLSSLV